MRGAGCPRVTQPFATLFAPRRAPYPFDLHVLGAPPAFILSQDRTLRSKNQALGLDKFSLRAVPAGERHVV